MDQMKNTKVVLTESKINHSFKVNRPIEGTGQNLYDNKQHLEKQSDDQVSEYDSDSDGVFDEDLSNEDDETR